MHNLFYALRYLAAPRGGKTIRIVSLTAGLTVGVIIFAFVHFRLTFDRFYPDSDRIYQVWTSSVVDGSRSESNLQYAPMAPALAETMPQIEAATRLMGTFHYDLYYDDEAFSTDFLAVDTSFFDVLDFGLVRGDASSFADASSVMLSESLARAVFGKSDPLGKTIMYKNQLACTVTGIFRDPPSNSHLGRFNSLCSLGMIANSYYMGWGGGDSFNTYFKLRRGACIGDIEAQFPAFCDKYGVTYGDREFDIRYYFMPVADASTNGSDTRSVAAILLALGILTLAVASLNYILISISTLIDRSKTVAMLRCNGARRCDVAAMFLWETAAILLASCLLAAAIVFAMQEWIERICGYSVADLFSVRSVWVPAAAVVGMFLLSGIVPAQLFARVPLHAAFRRSADSRRGWKRTLMFFQIAVSTAAVVFLSVVSMQFYLLRNGDIGYDHDRIVLAMPMGSRLHFETYIAQLEAMPEVESAGVSYDLPIYGYSGQPCYDENTREMLFSCRTSRIGSGWFRTMGIPIVAGRDFTAQSSEAEVIVNEEYVRRRGWSLDDAVGRQIIDRAEQTEPYRIAGVAADFCMNASSGNILPCVFHNLRAAMPDESLWYGGGWVTIRLREMSPENIAAVAELVGQWPSANNSHIDVYDERLRQELEAWRSFRDVITTAGAVTLLIALAGLAGYVSDEVRRRRKEIALRKVAGATSREVVAMFAADVLLLAVPAAAVGVAVSLWGGGRWLEMFSMRIPLRWWLFAGGAAAVLLLVLAVQILRVRRAAESDPADMINKQ